MARPVEFDRDTVLDNATNTFWQNGYFATSIADLVEATRLKPGSLYAAFESKEGLLLATIDFYGQRSLNKVRHYLDEAKMPLEGIRNYLSQLATARKQDEHYCGCFLVNTVLEVAPHNEKVRERVSHYLDQIEDAFLKAFQAARREGALGKDKDPKSLAKYLMVTIWGIRVLQKISSDEKTLKAVKKQFFQLLKA